MVAKDVDTAERERPQAPGSSLGATSIAPIDWSTGHGPHSEMSGPSWRCASQVPCFSFLRSTCGSSFTLQDPGLVHLSALSRTLQAPFYFAFRRSFVLAWFDVVSCASDSSGPPHVSFRTVPYVFHSLTALRPLCSVKSATR